jgi:hypothetical protein
VRDGVRRARASGHACFLPTETPGNVAFYGRLGFRTVERAKAPGGGPPIWFLRADPQGAPTIRDAIDHGP